MIEDDVGGVAWTMGPTVYRGGRHIPVD
jgi:hypothetical protein